MSASGKRLLSSVLLTFLFLFLISPLGATFLGVVSADMYLIAMTMMGICVVVWLLIRMQGRWVWHTTAFDLIFVLWGVAFALSVVSNMETVRRSMIGLWYMLLYIGVWYVLHDSLANRGLSRKLLVDAMLYAGVLIMLFSVVQLASQPEYKPVVSLIGNPNALGAVLLCMTPFAVGRAITSESRFGRLSWGIYSLVLIVNLLLTLSRGAWLGMFATLALLTLLLLTHYDMLSLSSLKMWWQGRTRFTRTAIGGIGFAALIGSMIAGGLLINSFSIPARRPELRTRLWNSALLQFAEKPITGQGLYTFGHDYGLSISIPNAQSHAHAHSVPFNILAEMGLVGIAVFLLSIGVVIRLVMRRWSQISGDDRLIWVAAISALLGFGIQHLFDLPAMMPIVALVGLLMLVLVCAPDQPKPMRAWHKRGHAIGIIILWVGLLVTGLWSGNLYQQYLDAMRISFAQTEDQNDTEHLDDLRETALLLDDVIAQDPLMPIYHQQQALVWGILAESGDEEAINNAVASFRLFLELEPNHSISWANLSALHWQAWDDVAAINAIEQAIELAPNYSFYRNTLKFYVGELERDVPIEVPEYQYNQGFASFEFLREPLSMTFLPQFEWATRANN